MTGFERLRRERNFTQVKLSKQIGISQTALSKIEKGKNLPRGKTLAKIAKALDVSMEEVMNALEAG